MKHIYDQITSKLESLYTCCTTLQDLTEIKRRADVYINDGLQKMQSSGVFTDDEITSVKNFANNMNIKIYKEYDSIIKNNVRINFIF